MDNLLLGLKVLIGHVIIHRKRNYEIKHQKFAGFKNYICQMARIFLRKVP